MAVRDLVRRVTRAAKHSFGRSVRSWNAKAHHRPVVEMLASGNWDLVEAEPYFSDPYLLDHPDARQQLLDGLLHKESWVKSAVEEHILNRLGSPGMRLALLEGLADDDFLLSQAVRQLIDWALDNGKNESLGPLLLSGLQESGAVREHCVGMLSKYPALLLKDDTVASLAAMLGATVLVPAKKANKRVLVPPEVKPHPIAEVASKWLSKYESWQATVDDDDKRVALTLALYKKALVHKSGVLWNELMSRHLTQMQLAPEEWESLVEIALMHDDKWVAKRMVELLANVEPQVPGPNSLLKNKGVQKALLAALVQEDRQKALQVVEVLVGWPYLLRQPEVLKVLVTQGLGSSDAVAEVRMVELFDHLCQTPISIPPEPPQEGELEDRATGEEGELGDRAQGQEAQGGRIVPIGAALVRHGLFSDDPSLQEKATKLLLAYPDVLTEAVLMKTAADMSGHVQDVAAQLAEKRGWKVASRASADKSTLGRDVGRVI